MSPNPPAYRKADFEAFSKSFSKVPEKPLVDTVPVDTRRRSDVL